jgi:hypothetical protein
MARATASTASIPAPVGGLNDRDSIAEMPKSDALILDNWWPYPSYIGVRKGSANHVTGFPGPVQTIAEYLPPTGGSKLFAVSNGSIYDATSPGTVGAAVVTGLSTSWMQWQGITTPGGSFLYMLNGVDKPRLWDGSTWKAIDSASTPAITGVATTKLVHATLFKNRLFFVESGSLNIWYLPVNSIGGAASQIDMGSIFRKGGYIQACYTWTIDAGAGSDDHFVIITSNGEVAVYQGSDPSSASDWSIVGVFTLGRPLGRKCGAKMGGDIIINSMEGLLPLSKALLSMTINRQVALSDKIQNSISEVTQNYQINDGWQVEVYPDANMVILNVPAGNGNNFQYVQNTISGAWTKFKGWNANCWLNSPSGLYFGSDSAVVKAWTSNTDNGVGIVADVLPAFSQFGSGARNKFFTMVRPNILTNGSPSINYGLNIDYTIQDPQGVLSYSPPTGMVWGSMVWGSMVWGGALVASSSWQTVGAVAKSASMRLRVNNGGADVRMTNVDYLHQVGGVL